MSAARGECSYIQFMLDWHNRHAHRELHAPPASLFPQCQRAVCTEARLRDTNSRGRFGSNCRH